MKINVEIDLDFINEDGTLEEEIRENIFKSVKDKIIESISEEAEYVIKGKIQEVAKQKCDELIDLFLDKPFTHTSEYGRVIEENITVRRLLEKGFNEYWHKKVDSRGSDYGNTKPRVEWLIDARIKEYAKTFSESITKDTENKIKTIMRESLSKSIGDKLTKELGFEKLLQLK